MKAPDYTFNPETKAYWSWQVHSDSLKLGLRFWDFFGIADKQQTPEHFKSAAALFSPENLKVFKDALKPLERNKSQSSFQAQTKHQSPDTNSGFILLWTAECVEWKKEKPTVLVGSATKQPIGLEDLAPEISFDQLAKTFFDNLPDSVYFKDRKSRFIYINNACAKKFGLSDPSEAIGKTDAYFFDEKHARQAFKDEQQVMKTEEPIIHQVEKEGALEKDQTVHWASTTKLPMYDNKGRVIGVFGITRDITAEVKEEEELKRNDALIAKFSEQVPGFFFLYYQQEDGEGRLPFASHGIQDLFNLHPEDVKSSANPILEIVHPDDLLAFRESIDEAAENATLWDFEFRVQLPDKGVRWLKGRANPTKIKGGAARAFGYITDITDYKNAIEQNTRLKEQFRALLDSAPNLIFVKDIDGKFLMANESAAAFFEETTSSIVGKYDVDLGFSDEKAQQFIEMDRKVIEQDEMTLIPEDNSIRPDGSEVWHQTIKVPFDNADSDKPAVLSIATDITQRKKNEIELNNSLEIIGAQNNRLTNFAHIVSHNLRNHAGNISMLLSLFDMEDDDVEQEELMEHLHTASERLNESIADLNEIIDQQYKPVTNQKELVLKETVAKVKEILITEILANNVSIKEEVPKGITLKYNPAYLESIILNLLSNAIKYRHPDRKPEILIKAKQQKGHVFLEVKDNGLGIDLEKNGDKLFGMYNTFHQNENAKGIGLFITKNQIESMGGTIKAESEPDRGTTFKVKLK